MEDYVIHMPLRCFSTEYGMFAVLYIIPYLWYRVRYVETYYTLCSFCLLFLWRHYKRDLIKLILLYKSLYFYLYKIICDSIVCRICSVLHLSLTWNNFFTNYIKSWHSLFSAFILPLHQNTVSCTFTCISVLNAIIIMYVHTLTKYYVLTVKYFYDSK